MALSDVWRDVSSRVGFFTKETSDQIPEGPGCYAWFIPLWIYSDDLKRLMTCLDGALRFDPKTGGSVERVAEFNWDAIAVSVSKLGLRSMTKEREEDWLRTIADPALKSAFEQALMEASIFMPPLYVGKADNLKARYGQHVMGAGGKANVFHSRFSQFSDEQALPLEVSDLLFVCIKTRPDTNELLEEAKLNDLLERILMLLCRPPFSLR